MSGMGGSGLTTNNPMIVSAFHAALVHQGLVILLVLVALGVVWNLLRRPHARSTPSGPDGGLETPGGGPETPGGGLETPGGGSETPIPEPAARRVLRIGFGLLWILDGILQAQASMPLGMVSQVISPTAKASPSWVQHLVSNMATTWSYHPIVAATAAVWIQLGIGVWLLVAPRGNISRLAGLAGAGWGLVVWIFGESFGGIFAPGLSWLTGAPGAVLIYCFAGVLIALPEGHWRAPRLARTILGVVGLFFVGMALLQAWPGRGFWQGRLAHSTTLGTLASSVQQMSQTPQPHWLSNWVAAFGGFDTAHGWAVNLFVVIALAMIGAAFLTARPPVVRVAVAAAIVLCLADWILIQDLGFLGGVGTDPNSMVPLILIFVAGYLALSAVPAPAGVHSRATAPPAPAEPGGLGEPPPLRWWEAGTLAARAASLRPALASWRERLAADTTYAFRSLAALGAVAVMLIGAAPMATAAANPNADPILAQAAYGSAEVTNTPTPGFSLVDQHGQRVSLASLHGKTVALGFFDPGCADQMGGCAAIQEFRLADQALGATKSRVEIVSIDTDPHYLHPVELLNFEGHQGLGKVGNWLCLTGRLSELSAVLSNFGVHMAGRRGMMGLPHGQTAYVIDGSGHTREVLSIGDRGATSKAMESSVAVDLANAIKHVVRSPSGGESREQTAPH